MNFRRFIFATLCLLLMVSKTSIASSCYEKGADHEENYECCYEQAEQGNPDAQYWVGYLS